MAEPTTLAGTASPGALVRVLLLFAALSSAPFVGAPWGTIPFGIALAVTLYACRAPACARRFEPHIFGVVATTLLGLLAIPGAWGVWPLPLLAAVLVYGALARLRPGMAEPTLVRGHADRGTRWLTAVFVLGSAAALLGWWWTTDPDLSDIASRLPAVHPVWLAVGGLGFASVNAVGEELTFRGLGTAALERAGLGPRAAIAVQAVSFGLLHIHGFPRGWLGVGLATVYGAMMGVLRRRSGGIAVPIAAHIVADLVIFGVLVTIATSAQPAF